jgi:hypothetical protein
MDVSKGGLSQNVRNAIFMHTSPRSVTPEATTYTAGQTMTMTVKGPTKGGTAAGLLLFVKASNGAHVGSFDGFNATRWQTLDQQCSKWGVAKTTLSHLSVDDKPNPFTFKWTAPKSGVGQVEVRGIVVTKDKSTWQVFNPVAVNGPGNVSAIATNTTANSTTGSTNDASANGYGVGQLLISFAAPIAFAMLAF